MKFAFNLLKNCLFIAVFPPILFIFALMFLIGSVYELINPRDYEKEPMTREEWTGLRF